MTPATTIVTGVIGVLVGMTVVSEGATSVVTGIVALTPGPTLVSMPAGLSVKKSSLAEIETTDIGSLDRQDRPFGESAVDGLRVNRNRLWWLIRLQSSDLHSEAVNISLDARQGGTTPPRAPDDPLPLESNDLNTSLDHGMRASLFLLK